MWPKIGSRRGKGDVLIRLVPESGQLDDLIAAVATYRGRPIHVLPIPARTDGPTGLWAATEAADYIVLPETTAPTHRATVVCHELAHMMLGHEPVASEALTEMAQVAAPSVRPEVAMRLLAREVSHECPKEVEAEQLGTRIVAQLNRNAARASWSGVTQRLR